MKRRGIKLIAGLVTAGMLAATGFVGIQTIGDITTTETIEYEMEENEAGGYDLSPVFYPRADDTGYPYLSGLEKSLPKGTRYVRVKMQGYNQPVLVVFPSTNNYYAKLYTEKSGRNVRCIGEIYTNNGIRIYNGVIHTSYIASQYCFRLITLYVSSDGNGVVIKDNIEATPNGYSGYSNNDGNGHFHKINGGNDGDALVNKFCFDHESGQWLWELCKTR